MDSGKRQAASRLLILTVSFFFVGFFPLSLLNLSHIAEGWKERIQIRVFLQSGLSDADTQGLQNGWKKWEEIAEVRWISRDQALEQLVSDRSWRSERTSVLALVESLGENPLPHTLILVPRPDFRTGEGVQKIFLKLQSVPEVDDILYDRQGIENLDLFSGLIKTAEIWGGGVMALFLVVLAVAVMSGSFPRKEASETEENSGITEAGTNVSPAVGGGLIGVGGALLSLLLWFLFLKILAAKVPLSGLTGLSGAQWSFFPWAWMGAWIIGGGILGALGGGLASLARK